MPLGMEVDLGKGHIMLTLYGQIKTAEQQTVILQYGDCYTGR